MNIVYIIPTLFLLPSVLSLFFSRFKFTDPYLLIVTYVSLEVYKYSLLSPFSGLNSGMFSSIEVCL